MIDEQDTVLELQFTGGEAENEAAKMVERAQTRFRHTQASVTRGETGVTLKLVFDVSVEK